MVSVETVEGRWFTIVVFIATTIIVITGIANAIYWDRVRKGTCKAISQNEADVLFWTNVIMTVIAGIIWLWALWRFINSPTYYKELKARDKAGYAAIQVPQTTQYIDYRTVQAQMAAQTRAAQMAASAVPGAPPTTYPGATIQN